MASKQTAWEVAIAEARVVRINGGERFISYPTIAMRDAGLATLRDAEVDVEIVRA
jgi:hypothetical protein